MIFNPTPDGWQSFRNAVANIPNLKDGKFFPIMGNFQVAEEHRVWGKDVP